MTSYSVRIFDGTSPRHDEADYAVLTGFGSHDEAWSGAQRYLRDDPRWSADEFVHRIAENIPLANRRQTVDLRTDRSAGAPVSVRVSEDPA